MVINAQNLSMLSMGYSAAFNKAFEESAINYPRVAMVIPSCTKETTYGWLGQMPRMREWIGEREIQNLMAHSYTIENKNYEITVEVPVNDIADDLFGVYMPIFAETGMSAKAHPDELVFDMLGKGFVNPCYDKKPFFSDKHPLDNFNKEFQSNLGKKKLAAASYQEARRIIMSIKGEHGKSLKIMPDLLVVSPYLEAVAREILFADLIVGSTNINKNTCELLVVPELADYPEQWYLLCTKRHVKPLVFQEREKPKLVIKSNETDDNVFFYDNVIYGVKGRYNVGFGLWQLAYGSTGEEDVSIYEVMG